MNTATKAWERLTRLTKLVDYSDTLFKNVKRDPALYERLCSLIEEARSQDDWYQAYNDLIEKVAGRYNSGTGFYEYTNEFKISYGNYSVLMAAVEGRCDLLDGATLVASLAEKEELEAQFERRSTTTIADSMYGRKTWAYVYIPTGEKVSSYRDREGSLGS